MSRIKGIRRFEKMLIKKSKTSEEIRIEELRKSDVGKLLIDSDEFKSGKVDLKNLCLSFDECKYVANNGHIQTPHEAYIMYWLVCGDKKDIICKNYQNYK